MMEGQEERGKCIRIKSKELKMLEEIREDDFLKCVQRVIILREVNEIESEKVKKFECGYKFPP